MQVDSHLTTPVSTQLSMQGGAPKIGGIIGLFGLAGGIGYSIFLGSKIWSDFDKGVAQKEDNAPAVLTAGIVVFFALAALLSLPVWINTFRGLLKLGIMNIFVVGALIGMGVLCLSLNQRYTGGLQQIDETSARCPNGQILRRSAENNCQINVGQCTGDNKLTNVWKWWEIPTLAIGGSVFAVAWFGLLYLYVKKGKSML